MKNQKRSTKMDLSTWVLVIISLILLVYAIFRDKSLAIQGVKLAGSTIWNNLALLLASFLIAGLVQVLIPKEMIARWLGNQAGIKGIFIGCVAGGLIPGSPYAVFPIAGGLYQAGAGLGAMVGFISAWSLWSVSRLPVEIALISPKAAFTRYAITFIFPPIAGLAAHAFSKIIR